MCRGRLRATWARQPPPLPSSLSPPVCAVANSSPPQPLPATLSIAKALPALPAAPLPALPKSSDRALPTQELGNLFWQGLHSALQPAAMDEQWMAVRRLLTVA